MLKISKGNKKTEAAIRRATVATTGTIAKYFICVESFNALRLDEA